MSDTFSNPGSAAPTKVVIIGGGCGGVAAAWWLTSTPELRAKFNITLYTRGWRLGGKCASGRNADLGYRIEEHGLHLWMGFYQNAFRTIQAAYAEWQPPANSPFRTWTDAFSPLWTLVLEEAADPGWDPWTFDLPQLPGTPGDLGRMTLSRRVVTSSFRLQRFCRENLPEQLPRDVVDPALRSLRKAANDPENPPLFSEAKDLLQNVQHRLQAAFDRVMPAGRTAEATMFSQPQKVSGELQRLLIIANLGFALMAGYLTDILPTDPANDHQAAYDALNDQEFREWLSSRGALDETVTSPLITCLYDLAFAYPGGDASSIANGALPAGVSFRFLEMFLLEYKDAPLWHMNAGMGDAVFTPLFDVLMARGVTINFFHRLESVIPSADNKSIAQVNLVRQADLKSAPYQPLVTVRGLRCWPNAPDWSQLKNGNALQATGVDFESSWDTTSAGPPVQLTAGGDFDVLVLAVPPEVLKFVAPALSKASNKWADMLANSASVMTQAAQFWLSVPPSTLGYPFSMAPMSTFAEPFDTYCDMSHLLPVEDWPITDAPQAIAYSCGSMLGLVTAPPNPDPKAGVYVQVQVSETTWQSDNIRYLWPGVVNSTGQVEPGVITSMYLRPNYDPSDLYVQTPPGSVKYRLAPDSLVFSNLYLAGDWVYTIMSGGCVENAIRSGMIVAQSISGAAMPIAP
jgi:uncharacterized protein with NAD-binding domain and iron-sulfur cluster